MNLQIGSLISFSYRSSRSHDLYPEVLVLHPGWRFYPPKGRSVPGKPLVHGLNFNYMTDDEINMIRMIVDPGFQLKYFQNMENKNPGIAAEFDRIISHAGNANITNPLQFYTTVIKPFIMPRRYDPYRLYDPGLMQNVRMLQNVTQFTGKNRVSIFGNAQARAGGKSEQQIISDLALKKTQEEKMGVKQLTPTEDRLIRQLQGNALSLFNRYKQKFQYAKGPITNNRTPNFLGNQKTPFDPIDKTDQPKLPGFMNDDLDQ
jgi:hypothetical protein